jgi:hypothetical protein
MTESDMQISHIVVRTVATITLVYLGLALACARYPSSFCHTVANGWSGMIMTLLTIFTSLLLPLYVGLEGWWMRRNRITSRALWIDAAFALACLLLFCGSTLYAFRHYLMF